ncbi:MAG TPA: FAD-dependent oxidoreductase, partial [Polyangiaceae bacterium]
GTGMFTTNPREAHSQLLASHLPTQWHGVSDVVVVGFGAGGAAAAYEAARAGARVTIIDASPAGGGDTAISAGLIFIGGGTALQLAAGYNETPDQMFAVVKAMGGEGADPDVIRAWCEQGPALYEWLSADIGIEYDAQSLSFSGMEQHALFRQFAPRGVPIPHCHWAVGATSQSGGAALFSKLSAAALGAGHVTLTNRTKATRLIQDPISRRVLGVVTKAVDENGAFVPNAPERYVLATKAVVIATGAFSRDSAMMARHNPNLLFFHHWSQGNADGSGIRIAQQAGGDLRLMKAWWSMVFFAGMPTTTKGILVSPAGSRFVAEDGTYYWLGYHLVAEHQTAYLIYDRAILSDQSPDPNALVAPTIEDLADAINARDNVGMSRELLKAQVDAYNALADRDGASGRDPAFHKDPKFVVPIDSPPFYAVKHTSTEAQGTTSGGLRINRKSEVLSPNGTTVPGLFAAGTCANSTMSERYTGSGTAIAGALIFGRIAGQQAAAQGAWIR